MRHRPPIASLIGAAGAIVAMVASFLPWYRFVGDRASSVAIDQVAREEHLATAANFWKAWGAIPNLLFAVLVAVLLAAFALHAAAPRDRGPAILALGAAVALLGLTLGWVLHLPGPDELVSRAAGGWLALGGAAACLVAGVLALDAPHRAAEPGATSAGGSAAPAPR